MKHIVLKLCAVALLVFPLAAEAHTGSLGHGFFDGFIHPLIGLDHLLAMLVVGIWSVVRTRHIWPAPLCFILFLSVGTIAGQNGLSIAHLEPAVAASVLIFGLMLASSLTPGFFVSLVMIGAFAFCHGMAHGGELPESGSVLAGIVLGSAVLHALGIVCAVTLLEKQPHRVNRLGQLVALLGGVLFASNFV